MTVIIHDFEVVTEPPPATTGEAGDTGDAQPSAEAAAAAGPTPADVRFVMETHRRRSRRLWAH